ncbi:MAG: hypothetical protein IPG86_02120 [Chitinophagaceae bacterium]|nr:hypothetical protein [Chitinophagaceae bacterium]
MKFTNSLDTLAIIVTWAVTILFIIIIGIQVTELIREFSGLSVFVIALLLLTWVIAYALRPISYSITDKSVIIHRLLSDKTIARNNIKSVELFINGELNFAVRTFGVGGLFGYFGKFFKGSIGNMNWYATRRNKIVLIRTYESENIVVTPDDYQNFMRELTATASS